MVEGGGDGVKLGGADTVVAAPAGAGGARSGRAANDSLGVVATALAVRPRTGRSTARGRLSPRRGHVRARRGGHLRLAPQ